MNWIELNWYDLDIFWLSLNTKTVLLDLIVKNIIGWNYDDMSPSRPKVVRSKFIFGNITDNPKRDKISNIIKRCQDYVSLYLHAYVCTSKVDFDGNRFPESYRVFQGFTHTSLTWRFAFRLVPATPKNIAHFKSGQNWPKNNHPTFFY